MSIQYEMQKCIQCNAYYWKRLIKDNVCPYCTVPKEKDNPEIPITTNNEALNNTQEGESREQC
jgi:hypothetical protein